MTAVPPPYAPRDHSQVSSTPVPAFTNTNAPLEFNETASVTLEWRMTGLKAMFDSTRGETKSHRKCVKSAVFGDADNLWEVLWYPNSGVQGGDYASLYLSCVPTPQEREQGISGKWSRKGLWWFRFEIRSTINEERSNKPAILATKDASDHTFAVKTANWGWQQFSRRDMLFQHPSVERTDSFLIVCTIQAQSQPPAGYWLGVGLQPKEWTSAVTQVQANAAAGGSGSAVGGAMRVVGSGGGLSAWAGGEGASGGVAGASTAGGGVKRVVPKDLVSGVGALLDDQLYSDIEFIINPPYSRKRPHGGMEFERNVRRIYANKKLLDRCDYFHAMFNSGFREGEGIINDDDEDEDMESLSDSDVEDEAAETLHLQPLPNSSISPSTSHFPQSTSTPSPRGHKPNISTSTSTKPEDDEIRTEEDEENEKDGASQTPGEEVEEREVEMGISGGGGISEVVVPATPKREIGAERPSVPREGVQIGPKKTKVIIRDAAWSTWWAVLYWLYTDVIFFAPLISSFTHPPNPPSRPSSISAIPPAPEARNRSEWIRTWMDEHNIAHSPTSTSGDPLGPRPVSAKAVYRLADKLDLQALKLRAFQHIIGGLNAQNVPAEVFSRFSSTFEDVRKVQIAFFLKHWSEIKKSETMMQIWQQIRVGKHVGFEEVWPLIVSQLDFKPS